MERNKAILLGKCAAILSVVPMLMWAYKDGPDVRNTGGPGDSPRTCGGFSNCHLSFAVNSGTGRINVDFEGGATYRPGIKQRVTVRVDDPDYRGFGFQASARLVSNLMNGQAGTFTPIDSSTQVLCEDTNNPRPSAGCRTTVLEFVEHTLPRQRGEAFAFDWTPPASDVGQIRFYVAVNAANLDNSSNRDRIYSANFTLSPAAGGGPRPSISQGGVADAFTFRAGTAQGTWTAIFGSNLSPTTRTWAAADFRDGRLPTELDGVSVSINNKSAYVFFISPTQINVLSPADTDTGNVSVVVTNPSGSSPAATVTKSTHHPAFYAPFGQNDRLFATALSGTTNDILGKPGVEPRAIRAARPNEVVVLYGTGFGPTDPVLPVDQVAARNAELNPRPTVRIGDVVAEVQFAGLIAPYAGLYQFNVRIPDLPSGDHPLIGEIGGIRSSDKVYITIQR